MKQGLEPASGEDIWNNRVWLAESLSKLGLLYSHTLSCSSLLALENLYASTPNAINGYIFLQRWFEWELPRIVWEVHTSWRMPLPCLNVLRALLSAENELTWQRIRKKYYDHGCFLPPIQKSINQPNKFNINSKGITPKEHAKTLEIVSASKQRFTINQTFCDNFLSPQVYQSKVLR